MTRAETDTTADNPSQVEMDQPLVVVPRENAVFWMDRHGFWNNEGGRFELKKIIRRFNTAIQKDTGGYFVTQINGDRREKVYFPYEDTALFAIDIQIQEILIMRLNTGRRLPLDPDKLYYHGESLYTVAEADWIKFSERSLLKIAPLVDFQSEPYIFHFKEKRYPIQKRILTGDAS
ncbi:MFS transporter permease [bacterium]|nr:MFS transporter permease [bacterium]